MKIRGSITAFPLALSFLPGFLLSIPADAQRTPVIPAAASAPTAIPALVPYSGVAVAADGKPLNREAGISFSILKEEQAASRSGSKLKASPWIPLATTGSS